MIFADAALTLLRVYSVVWSRVQRHVVACTALRYRVYRVALSRLQRYVVACAESRCRVR